MDNEILKRMQDVQLEIALEVKRICDLLGIDYFLDSGTLLGAVRHQGFIPWDDDIDMGMLRKDYDIFLKEAPQLLDEKYFLQTWESDKSFPGAYSKIRKNGTIYREAESQESQSHEGIYVDLFPYDVYPNKDKDRKWQKRRYYIIKRMLISYCDYKPWASQTGLKRIIKKIVYSFITLLSKAIGKNRLISSYKYFSQRFNDQDSDYYYEQASIAPYGKWIIPRECLDELTELSFENHLFKCPKNYDLYLRTVYGDYMELPPVEKRANHHNILEISFGNE